MTPSDYINDEKIDLQEFKVHIDNCLNIYPDDILNSEIPSLIQILHDDNDIFNILEAIIRLRKIITNRKDDQINQQVIDSGIISQIFPRFLHSKISHLQMEACWIIGTLVALKSLEDLNAFKSLEDLETPSLCNDVLELVHSKYPGVRLHSLLAITNMMIDDNSLCETVLNTGFANIVCEMYHDASTNDKDDAFYILQILFCISYKKGAHVIMPNQIKKGLSILCDIVLDPSTTEERCADSLKLLLNWNYKRQFKKCKGKMKERLNELKLASSSSTRVSNLSSKLLIWFN